MKLTKFNAANMPKTRGVSSILPRITFAKNGVISVNKFAAELLDLKGTDKLSIAQDEEESANWYIYKDKDGFPLKLKDKTGTLAFNHKALATTFKESFGIPVDQTQSYLLAGQPETFEKTKYWGILVANS